MDRHHKHGRKLAVLEWLIQLLIVYSMVTLLVELEIPGGHTMPFFVWSERIVALLFTIEYLARWAASRSLWYPFRPMALLDLAAVLPFYLGFLVDLRSLRLVRTLRVLRLLKLSRYNRAMSNLAKSFHRVRYEFGVVGFMAVIILVFSSVTMFELEREEQPESFGRLSDAAWWSIVTLTTVGYGDRYPVTGGGKIVASLTMVSGVAMFATFTSLIGSAFLSVVQEQKEQRQKSDEKRVSS